MGSGHNRAIFISLAGFALLLGLGLAAYRAPAPAADGAATVFSARRARAVLQELLGNEAPHPLGSADNAQVRRVIVSKLWELGYATELESGWVCSDFGVCGMPTNIVARLKGGEAGDALLLAAHYDSVPAGPGASDDGAGVAAVLEIARILTLKPPLKHEVMLLITDGEEAGLLGAELFVRSHPLAGRIKAAVNLEARGISGPSLMFETGSANRWLVQLYGKSIAHPITNSLFYVAYKALPNNTDFSIFKRASFQGYNFAYIGGVARYHTPQDDLSQVSLASLQQQGSNALAVVEALGTSPDLRPPGGEAVYFDVFAQGLVHWPATASVPAALLSSALWMMLAGMLIAKRRVDLPQILWGALCACAHLIGGALGVGLLVGGLTWAGLLPPLSGGSWIAHPLPMTMASIAISVAVGSGLGPAMQRRSSFWGLWCGAALTMQSLAAGLAVFAAGSCFVPLIAMFTLCVAALPCILHAWRSRTASPTPRWRTDVAVVVPALATAALLLPMVLMLYTALGTPAWPIDALFASLATLMLLPALAGAPRRAHVRLAGAAAAVAGIGVFITLMVPTYSVAWPMRLNFNYRLDVDRHRADWLALSSGSRLPGAVAAAADFDRKTSPATPGSDNDAFRAPAPFHELAAPQLHVKERSRHSDDASTWTHYVVHLDSARNAPRAFIVFPSETGVQRAASQTTAGLQQFELRSVGLGATRLDFATLPKVGVDVAFDTRAARPRIVVADLSYGLPEDGQILRQARPADATSSQDGDVTVVQLTVPLEPASGRENQDLSPP